MSALQAVGKRSGRGLGVLRHLSWIALPLLLAWTWKDIPLADILAILLQVDLGEIGVLATLNLVILLLFSLRWWLFLRWLGYSLPILEIFGKRLAGFGVSYFTPGPQFGGEPLQVYLLSRRGVKGPAALASVTLDKILELLANFTFLAAGVGLALVEGVRSTPGLLVLPAVLLLLPLAYLASLGSGIQPAARLTGWLARRSGLPWLFNIHLQVEAGESLASEMVRQRAVHMTAVFFYSMGVWGLSLLEYWLMMHFLGLAISPSQALIALTAARLAFLLPLPGGAGVLEASQVLAMQQLGLGIVFGAGAGLLIRVRDVLLAGSGLVIGAFYLQKGREK